MKALQIHPGSIFKAGGKPILDSSLRYRINYEVFFFANRAEMARFKKNPLRFSGLLTDPVTMERFAPTAASPRAEYGDRFYYFLSDTNRAKFLGNPIQYKDRRSGTN